MHFWFKKVKLPTLRELVQIKYVLELSDSQSPKLLMHICVFYVMSQITIPLEFMGQ